MQILLLGGSAALLPPPLESRALGRDPDPRGAVLTDPCVLFPPRAALGAWHTRCETNR